MVEKAVLAEHLEAIIHDRYQPRTCIDTETPVDKTLDLVNDLMMGQMPSIHDTLELYNMITQARDLRAPVQLERQLMEDLTMEPEVSSALLEMLQV